MAKIECESFGKTKCGEDVKKYILSNSQGTKIGIVDYGASIQSILTTDKDGKFTDIAHGYATVLEYELDKCYVGALCGRVANRVGGAKFTIDGVTSNVSVNDPPNHIHGGFVGFNKKVFKSKIVDNTIEMTYTSPDGEEGYPGTLTVTAIYELTAENTLNIKISAKTTKPTIVNLVQHTYFNLAGHTEANIYDHFLTVNGDNYTPKKENGYPSGDIISVKGTVMDFTKPRILRESIENIPDDKTGYDHNICLNSQDIKMLAAKLEDRKSGRVLNVYTNQAGLQVYTSNYLCGAQGKDSVKYHKHGAVCLETQNYPDAINQPKFPNAIVRPEKDYFHEIVYEFTTQ